jgi:hypothetical protein
MKVVVALFAILALIALGAVGYWIYGLFQPIHLACQGELVTTLGSTASAPRTLHVEVDLRNGTVAIQAFSRQRFKIETAKEDNIDFSGPNVTGLLDRYTGSIAVISGGNLNMEFHGLCRQAARLF